MQDLKLKPCPFCGGEAVTSFQTTDPENKFAFGWVGCQNCRCFINYMNNAKGLKEATETWNRRAENGKIKEFAERLKKEAFECDVSFGYGKECYTEAVTTIEIDRLTKEMTEGGNG